MQTDTFLLREIFTFVVIYILGALMVALGATVTVAKRAESHRQLMDQVAQMSFWANYVTVMIVVLLPASWVAAVGVTQKGMPVLITSVVSFFTTGLAMEEHAARTVQQALTKLNEVS